MLVYHHVGGLSQFVISFSTSKTDQQLSNSRIYLPERSSSESFWGDPKAKATEPMMCYTGPQEIALMMG